MNQAIKSANVNERIRARVILLITENGDNLGKVSLNEGLSRAEQVKLDLVEVNSDSNEAPICKIMDFGKWKYEQSKREKKKKSQTQKQSVKEIKFRPNIGDNDLKYRAKHADQFLSKKDKVKLIVRFRGREQEHMFNTGKRLLKRFLKLVTHDYEIDGNARVEGCAIVMIIMPSKK